MFQIAALIPSHENPVCFVYQSASWKISRKFRNVCTRICTISLQNVKSVQMNCSTGNFVGKSWRSFRHPLTYLLSFRHKRTLNRIKHRFRRDRFNPSPNKANYSSSLTKVERCQVPKTSVKNVKSITSRRYCTHAARLND